MVRRVLYLDTQDDELTSTTVSAESVSAMYTMYMAITCLLLTLCIRVFVCDKRRRSIDLCITMIELHLLAADSSAAGVSFEQLKIFGTSPSYLTLRRRLRTDAELL